MRFAHLLLVTTCSAVIPITSASEPVQTIPERLGRYLAARAAISDFSGVVIVEQDRQLLIETSYGEADYELNVPNVAERIFRIGSLSKPFTATAVMRLQEEKKLTVDDPVCRFLSTCPEAWRAVRLRDLLSHTSGIPDYFNEVRATPLAEMRKAIDEVIRAHAASSLKNVPGAVYEYSNFGYLLLGYVLEVAAGQPWEVVLRTRVFAPAGLHNTAYDDVWAIVPGRARGYARSGGALMNIAYKDHGAFAAGGLRSSAHDLLRFEHALVDGKVLSSDSRLRMFTPVHGDYGFGWQISRFFGRRVVNHTGEIDGFASHLAFYPDDRLVVIVLSNVESEPAKATACDLARIVFGAGATVLDRPENDRGGGPLDSFAASYGDEATGTREVTIRGGKLYYRRGESEGVEMKRISPSEFTVSGVRGFTLSFTDHSLIVTDACGVSTTYPRVERH